MMNLFYKLDESLAFFSQVSFGHVGASQAGFGVVGPY
jgi:hypothetical protein